MATLADYLRQLGGQINTGMQGLAPALEQGFNNPLTHAGLGIMMGSQQGGPGAAAGFMQGMQGYNQLRAQNADEADRKAMRELQQAQLARLQAGDKREDASRAAVMQALKSNPGMLGDMPLARTVLEATGDPSQLQGLGVLMPKQPTPVAPELVEHWKRQADQAERRSDLQSQQWGAQYGQRERQLDLQQRQFETENARKEAEAQRNTAAAKQKALISANDLDSKYQAAMAELDQYDKRLQEFAGMQGAPGAYGTTGMLAESFPKGTAAIAPGVSDAIARRKELQAQGMFSALVDLKGAGASLAPISNTDAEALKAKAGNLEAAQSWESAQKAIADIRAQVAATRQRVTQAYQADRSLYEAPATAPSVPQVGEVRQGYQYMGGDPANPASWRKQ